MKGGEQRVAYLIELGDDAAEAGRTLAEAKDATWRHVADYQWAGAGAAVLVRYDPRRDFAAYRNEPLYAVWNDERGWNANFSIPNESSDPLVVRSVFESLVPPPPPGPRTRGLSRVPPPPPGPRPRELPPRRLDPRVSWLLEHASEAARDPLEESIRLDVAADLSEEREGLEQANRIRAAAARARVEAWLRSRGDPRGGGEQVIPLRSRVGLAVAPPVRFALHAYAPRRRGPVYPPEHTCARYLPEQIVELRRGRPVFVRG